MACRLNNNNNNSNNNNSNNNNNHINDILYYIYTAICRPLIHIYSVDPHIATSTMIVYHNYRYMLHFATRCKARLVWQFCYEVQKWHGIAFNGVELNEKRDFSPSGSWVPTRLSWSRVLQTACSEKFQQLPRWVVAEATERQMGWTAQNMFSLKIQLSDQHKISQMIWSSRRGRNAKFSKKCCL